MYNLLKVNTCSKGQEAELDTRKLFSGTVERGAMKSLRKKKTSRCVCHIHIPSGVGSQPSFSPRTTYVLSLLKVKKAV